MFKKVICVLFFFNVILYNLLKPLKDLEGHGSLKSQFYYTHLSIG